MLRAGCLLAGVRPFEAASLVGVSREAMQGWYQRWGVELTGEDDWRITGHLSDDDLMFRFGCLASGIGQEETAALVGVTQSTISHWARRYGAWQAPKQRQLAKEKPPKNWRNWVNYYTAKSVYQLIYDAPASIRDEVVWDAAIEFPFLKKSLARKWPTAFEAQTIAVG